ncbi:MAG: hypothetical protein ACMUIU_08105 [bacterium]
MKRRIYIYFSILFLVALFSETAIAWIPIWQIGEPNYSSGEFVFSDMNVIEYIVPGNWKSMLDPNDANYGDWGIFPRLIYPFGEHENTPHEIRINFDYSEDYSSTYLEIWARSQGEDLNISLKIFKGETFIVERHITSPEFNPNDCFVALIGPIKMDSPEKNEIIIRSNGPPDMYIAFDYIALFSNDTDSFPRTLDVDVQKRGCFVNAVIRERAHGKDL